MRGNSKARNVLIIVLLVIISGFIIGSSIMNLTKKGDFYEGEVTNVQEFFSMKHTVNFIPTGKTYFYRAVDVKTGECIVFRASKNFIEKNGTGKTYIEGKIIPLKIDARNLLAQYSGDPIYGKYAYGTTKAVNAEIKNYSIQSIAMMTLIIILCIIGFINNKNQFLSNNKALTIIYYIVIVAALIYTMHLTTMLL